jgi:hypothetical protein
MCILRFLSYTMLQLESKGWWRPLGRPSVLLQ